MAMEITDNYSSYATQSMAERSRERKRNERDD